VNSQLQKRLDKKSTEAGFTSFELLVVLSIFAILVYVSAPKFRELAGSSERFAARGHLLEDIKNAQAIALTQGCRGIFTVAEDSRSYNFGCDYLAYDTNDPPAADVISFTRPLGGDVRLTADNIIIFNSRGQTVDIDDNQINVQLQLSSVKKGKRENFATGLLLGTGVFTYE